MPSITDLTALLPSHPSLASLLRTSRPLTHPSLLPPADVSKFLTKLSAHVTSRDPSLGGLAHRRAAWKVAREIVEQDAEGWVLVNGWGKTWVNALMALVSPSLPHGQLADLLPLLTIIFRRAAAFPAFSRDVALPVVPKCSQLLVGIAVEAEARAEWERVALVLDNLPLLFPLSPTPHRPLVSTLLPLLHRILITAPSFPIPSSIDGKPTTLAQRAAAVLAHLHILAGKVAASPAFHTDMLLALAESHTCLSALIDGALNLPPHHAPQQASTSVTYAQTVDTASRTDVPLGVLAREMPSEEKIQPFVRALEGWTAVMHALLAFPTARPVTLPLGGIIHLALRMLSCTPDVPLLEHVQGDSHLVACLDATRPKVWVAGLKLLSACTIATGAHVVPYLGLILDHTIHLSELLAATKSLAPQLAPFRFHVLVLSRIGTDPSASAYQVRLVKLCIGYVQLLLRQKPAAAAPEDVSIGKKGKKRMRGAGEDAFVGSLSGRVGQGAVGKNEGRVIVAALKLLSVLLPHPALPPALQAMAIRLVLSISYSLDTQSAAAVSEDLGMHQVISRAVEGVLNTAVKLRNGSGSMGPWTGLVLDRDNAKGNLSDAITSVIHPLLPPLSRPLPPLSSLVFLNAPGTLAESTEEQSLRAEMGIRTERELASDTEDARKRQRLDEPVSASVTTATVTSTVQSIVVTPPSAVPAVGPTFGSAPAVETRKLPPSAPPASAPVETPAVEIAHPDASIGHGSLSVQAVPPPVVLPPDVTTSAVQTPMATRSAPRAVVEDDDDFEMPEINMESDTDEDEE